MSSWSEGRRPLTLAILALGGEGGGVLADWIVALAERTGCFAQNTSVAGVAQRTGATVYYVEIFPPSAASGTGANAGETRTNETSGNGTARVREEPVMSIFPTPGEVDVVIASELMECGRAIQRGFATADRTTLITSTSRVYSIDEKMALGDGRVQERKLIEAAQRASKRLVAADFMDIAEKASSVISASLFGALAGSEALPFSREDFEAPIKDFGKAVEPSLAAFAAGFETAQDDLAATQAASEPANGGALPLTMWSGDSGPGDAAAPGRSTEQRKASRESERNALAASDPTSLVGPDLQELAERVRVLPAQARSMILDGLVRTAVYQSVDYAERYLERVEMLAAVDPDRDGQAGLTRESARHVALWMCYQDTIQVALQKTRRARMQRIREEAHARPNQLVQVHEFLHPQIEEITDTMPTWLGGWMLRSKAVHRIVQARTHKGMILNTSSAFGYTLLSTMARVRPFRPRSLRFGKEQAAIDAWIALALEAAASDAELAREIVECQRVLKGYGATYAHGGESFTKLMDAARGSVGEQDAAPRLAELRAAALADEDGAELDAKLSVQPA
jgi:indolepyruvate ferredoxin oxidoreductase beta subunit